MLNRLPKRGCLGAQVSGQIFIARTHSQPIRLAHRRAGDDVGGQCQVDRHAPDDHDLLGVLLPEVRPIGAHEGEQDRDDRRDAFEVPGPRGPLERLADGAN